MRKFWTLTLFISLFVLSGLNSMVFAQASDEVQIKDAEGMQLQLVRHAQDPLSKQVKFDLIVYSKIRSDRVQVTWQIRGVSEMVSEATTILSIKENETYTVPLIIRPRQFGVTNVRATVEAFQVDGTRIATASTILPSGQDGGVLAAGNNQTLVQVIFWIQIIAAIVLAVLVFYLLGKFLWEIVMRSRSQNLEEV